MVFSDEDIKFLKCCGARKVMSKFPRKTPKETTEDRDSRLEEEEWPLATLKLCIGTLPITFQRSKGWQQVKKANQALIVPCVRCPYKPAFPGQ